MSLSSFIDVITSSPQPLTREEEATATPNDLVRHNLRLAYSIARKYFTGNEEDDYDILAEGIAAMTRQSRTFDATRGKFSTVATHTIRRACWKEKNKIRQKIKGMDSVYMQEHGITFVEVDNERDGEDTKVEMEVEVMDLVSSLTPDEKEVMVRKYWEGRTNREISADYPMAKSLIESAMRKIRARTKDG